MAKLGKNITEPLRKVLMEYLQEKSAEQYDFTLTIGNNMFAVPLCDDDGNEFWAKVTVAIPTGDRDGGGFDAESLAEDYKLHQEELAEKKAEVEAKRKADELARQKRREEKEKAKEK